MNHLTSDTPAFLPDAYATDRDAPAAPLGTPPADERRPFDYVWNGQRITHYLNHAHEWHGCPATERHHHTLRVAS